MGKMMMFDISNVNYYSIIYSLKGLLYKIYKKN